MSRQTLISLLPNTLALSGVQAVNFITPIVVYTYLARVLAVDGLGLVFFSLATCGYFVQLADYGFSNTAVKQIAQSKDQIKELPRICSTILFTRLALALGGFIALTILLLFIPTFRENWKLIVMSYPLVVGQALFPYWFFQGTQRMNYHAVINLISKLLFGLLIFCFVRMESDFSLVNLCQGIALVIAAIVGWIILLAKFNFRFVRIAPYQVLQELKQGFPYFISNFALSQGSNSMVVVLNFFAGPTAAGIYGLAEKIMQALRAGAVIIYQVTLPRVSYLAGMPFAEMRAFLLIVMKWSLPVFIFGSTLLCLSADKVILLIAGHHYREGVAALQVLSWVPIAAILSMVPSQILIVNNFYNSYVKATWLTAIAGVLSALVMVPIYGIIGAAYSLLFLEFLSMASLYLVVEVGHPSYSIINSGTS